AGYTEEEIVYQNDGKTIKHIKILDSKTKKEIKRIVYRLNGISIYYINEYTSEGIIIKITYYYDNGKEISSIDEFNPEGKPIKTTYYQYDGKTISSIDEYNPEGIKIIKKTYYNRDGTIKEVKYLKDNIERKNEVVKLTTEKKIVYHPDGKTIYYIQEFNPEGKIIKVIYYQ
ncbi:DUF2963 domain-containing protein, partial [Chrysanthemum yellows phytoplasma]|uniref:DUF2963 domain-containing protein n=1 Tax=Chrysanthemum yellows phytoplasma TaxID=238674 RepID=UPI00054CBD03